MRSKSKSGLVYILLLYYKSGETGTYIGETVNIKRRLRQHRINILKHKTKTHVGKAEDFHLLGFKWFEDRKKTEREMKDKRKLRKDQKKAKQETVKLGLAWGKENAEYKNR